MKTFNLILAAAVALPLALAGCDRYTSKTTRTQTDSDGNVVRQETKTVHQDDNGNVTVQKERTDRTVDNR